MPRARDADLLLQIGRRVRELRKARGLSQEQFAELLDISAVGLCRAELGERALSLALLDRAAKHLGVRLGDLVDVSSRKPPKATLAPDEHELLRGYRTMTPAWRKLVRSLLTEAGRSKERTRK